MNYAGENSLKKIFTLIESSFARKVHTHNYAASSSAGGAATSADKVNSSLTVQLNGGSTEGTDKYTFDGSDAKNINITPASIGAVTKTYVDDACSTTVQYTTQELTDEEKAQARTNIGAIQESHTHTKSQITDFPTLFIDTTDPATEGYTLLGVLSHNTKTTFTIPTWASEIMLNVKNLTTSLAEGPRVYCDFYSNTSNSTASNTVYLLKVATSTTVDPGAYSGLSFRKSAHLANVMLRGTGNDGLYVFTDVTISSSGSVSSLDLEYMLLESTFAVQLGSSSTYSTGGYTGTIELWYR